MQAAFAHSLMFVVAAVIAILGWYMARNPMRTLRFFTFGTEPAFGHEFGVAWCRIVGWFFAVGGTLGVLLYLVLLPMDLLASLRKPALEVQTGTRR
jgi:hypothetical protein